MCDRLRRHGREDGFTAEDPISVGGSIARCLRARGILQQQGFDFAPFARAATSQLDERPLLVTARRL